MTKIRLGFLLAALLLTGFGVQAAEGEAAAADPQDPGPPLLEVDVNLETQEVKKTLPFDVPFYLTGDVEDVQRIELSYFESKRLFYVRRVGDEFVCYGQDPERKRKNASRFPVETARQDEETECAFVRGISTWDRSAVAKESAKPKFRLRVPPLQANRFYNLAFTVTNRLSEPTLKTFHDDATRILKEKAWTTQQDEDQTGAPPATVQELQRDLKQSIEELASDRDLHFPERTGNFFDEDNVSRELQLLFDETLGSALDAKWFIKENVGASDHVAQWQALWPTLENQLTNLWGHSSGARAPLAKLFKALEAEARLEAEAATVWLKVRTQAQALGLLGPAAVDPRAHFERLARGQGADATEEVVVLDMHCRWDEPEKKPPVGPSVCDEAAARKVASNYEALAELLDRFKSSLERLVNPRGENHDLVQGFLLRPQETGLTRADLDRPGDGLRSVVLPLVQSARDLIQPKTGKRLHTFADEAANDFGEMQEKIVSFESEMKRLAKTIQVRAADEIVFTTASTIGTFETRQKAYISADFGFVWAPELDKTVPYAGANIYLRPINKQAPLSSAVNRRVLKRLAFSVGVTLKSTETPETETLFGSNSLVVGVGYRVTDALRLGLGALVINEKDPNPLIDDKSLAFTYYFSSTLDWDVKTLLQKFGEVFK